MSLPYLSFLHLNEYPTTEELDFTVLEHGFWASERLLTGSSRSTIQPAIVNFWTHPFASVQRRPYRTTGILLVFHCSADLQPIFQHTAHHVPPSHNSAPPNQDSESIRMARKLFPNVNSGWPARCRHVGCTSRSRTLLSPRESYSPSRES